MTETVVLPVILEATCVLILKLFLHILSDIYFSKFLDQKLNLL